MNRLDDIFPAVLKTSDHIYRDYIDCAADELNRRIRNAIEEELKAKQEEKEKAREEELIRIANQEKDKYDSDKIKFYSDPIHWTNNKRKRNNMNTLRGNTNKNRVTKFHSFKPTPRIFYAIEEIIEVRLHNEMNNSNFFNNFVTIGGEDKNG